MKKVFVVALPDGHFLDEDGEYSTFFYAKMFDTKILAVEFAAGHLEYGVHFRIDKMYVQTIS